MSAIGKFQEKSNPFHTPNWWRLLWTAPESIKSVRHFWNIYLSSFSDRIWPTFFVQFLGLFSDLPTYPKIGRHLWMFCHWSSRKTVKAKTLSCLIWTFFVVTEIWREGYFQIHVNFITMILWDIILIHGCFIKRRKFKFSFFPCLFLYKNPIIHVIKTRRLDSTIWSSL